MINKIVITFCLLYIALKRKFEALGLWCLTTLSTISQLYHSEQFYWWRKLEYSEKTTDQPQVTDKLHQIKLYRILLKMGTIQTHNCSDDRH